MINSLYRPSTSAAIFFSFCPSSPAVSRYVSVMRSFKSGMLAGPF